MRCGRERRESCGDEMQPAKAVGAGSSRRPCASYRLGVGGRKEERDGEEEEKKQREERKRKRKKKKNRNKEERRRNGGMVARRRNRGTKKMKWGRSGK